MTWCLLGESAGGGEGEAEGPVGGSDRSEGEGGVPQGQTAG